MANITTIGNVPSFSLSAWKGSTLPTAYNNSMDVYEALVQMTDYLNQMGLLVNTVADQWNQITTWITEDGLNQMVVAQLNAWVQDGTFTKILEDTALSDITTKLNKEISDRASEDIRIQNALQANIDNVVKDMKELVATINANLQGQITTLYNKHTADVTTLTNTINTNDTKQSLNVNALKAQFQNEIDHMANGAPVAAYDTLAELQASFPNGANGAYLVNADGYVYFWRNGAWKQAVKYSSDTLTQSTMAGSNAIVYSDLPINVDRESNQIQFPSGKVFLSGKEYAYTAQNIDWQNNNFLFFHRDTATFTLGAPGSDSTCVGATYLDQWGRKFLQVNANQIVYNGFDGDRAANVSDAYRSGVALIITDKGLPIWCNLKGTTMHIPAGHIYAGKNGYTFDDVTVSISAGYLCFNRVTKEFAMGDVDWSGDWLMVGYFMPSTLHTGGTLTPHFYGNPDWYVSETEDQLETGEIYKNVSSTELMSSTRGVFFPNDENAQVVMNSVTKTISFPAGKMVIAGHQYDTESHSIPFTNSDWLNFDRKTKKFYLNGLSETNWYQLNVGFIKTLGKTQIYMPTPSAYISYINPSTGGGNATTNLNAGFLTDSFGVHLSVDKDYIDYLKIYLERKGYNLNINRDSIGGTQITKRVGRTDSFSERIDNFKGTNDDFLIIQGGTNDWGAGNPLGTIDDTNPETFMGALNYLITTANADFPQIQLYFAAPIYRWDDDSTKPGKENSVGYTIDQYIDAMKQVCAKYNVPCIDLKAETGIYPWQNGETTLVDRLHPTELGHQRIARAINSHLGY